MTATGAVAGMLALQAVIDNQVRTALLWLVVCQILDGLDGPIARKLDVVIHAPRVNGNILDLVVDYVTCVVVPVIFLVQLHLLPPRFEVIIAGLIFLFSALWFARTDLETTDHWFNGFPAVWNLVLPTFLFLHSTRTEVAVICLILCASQLTTIKFPHLMRVVPMKNLTIPFAIIYIVNLSVLSWQYSDTNGPGASIFGKAILIGFPLYIFTLSIWRTFFWGTRIPVLGFIRKPENLG